MSVLEFVASLVRAAAWPATVVLALLLLRRELGTLLTHRLSSIEKDGKSYKVYFNEAAGAAIRAKGPAERVLGAAEVESPVNELGDASRLAQTSPLEAIEQVYALLEDVLRQRLSGVEDPTTRMQAGAHGLAQAARKHGLINDATVQAVEGLSHLRALAQREGPRLSVHRALDYVRLAEATLYAIRQSASGS